jgi:hypothetical protein
MWGFQHDIGYKNGPLAILCHVVYATLGFIQSTELTAAGVRKIIMKPEDQAVVYKEDTGYVMADPLLKQQILFEGRCS